MANLRGRIIRTGFGAKALGFKNNSMKSIAAAGAVLALATTGTVVVQTQTAPAALAQPEQPAAEATAAQDQIIDADMIASGRVTNAANLTDAHGVGKGLISGHVYMATPGGNPGAAYDNGNVKLDGITVYAQFRDKDGSYSPVFSAKTHTLPGVVGGNGGKGTFAFGTGGKGITWKDKLGREHTWAARTDQKHRIWVEPFTNDRGNKVVMFRQANGFVPGSFNGLVESPLGSFAVADGNIQQMAAFLQEVPPNHETSWMAAKGDKLVEDPEGPISAASTQTKVPNTISGRVWLETGGPDKGIVATGPAMNGIDEAADGYTVYASTLTKDGAAANQKLHEQYKDDPGKLAGATKKMLEDHPEYILKTVHGKTDNKGNYTLRFGKYEKGQKREDILNPDHVFVWVENKDGVVQNGYTGFHTPIFRRFDGGGNFRASAIPGENQLPIDFNGFPFQNLNSLYNVNYGIMPYTPVSITADYNATDNPAAPGTKVTPELNGDLSALSSKVEWRDQKGNVLKTCELDQSKGIKAQVAACTFDIPKDAKKGDYFNVVLVSGGNDVSAWTVLVTKDADEFAPSYEDKLVVPGEETKSSPTFTDKDGKDAKAPEGSKFAIPEDFTAPEGYEVKIDENTGEVTVTFPDESKLNKDTTEEFDVPVTVTYPDGSTDKTDANFKLDTDGDGKPDTEDEDDDNDGIPDKDDSNPKVPNTNDHFEPGYEDGSGKPGSDVKIDAPSFTDKDGNPTEAPEGTKFTPGDDAPEGVTVDENTGEITVPVPEDATPGDEITVPVVVTYPDGSKDNVDVTVTVTEKDNGVFEPEYEGKLVVPGEETKSSPTFTKAGKDENGEPTEEKVDAPEGSKFKISEDFTAPEGYEVKIDENTGEVTVTFPDESKLNKDTVEEFDVPVTVTYPDGSEDNAKAKFELDTDNDTVPDSKDNDDDNDGYTDEQEEEKGSNPKDKGSIPATPLQPGNPTDAATVEPGYEDGSGKPGEDVTVPAPEFKDKDGNPTTAPEGTTFGPGENAPEGVTVNEDGSVKVTIPEDANPGDKITVPVEVTYPDGSKDNVDVTVTVTDKDNGVFEPGYEDGSGKPGSDVKIDAPSFTDKDGNPTEAPEGTKFTPGDDAPEGVTVDENTGEITVPVPEDATPGDEITVPVVVTYPDGSKDNVDVTVTVTEKDNGVFEPEYEGKLVVPGEETKSSPTFTKAGKDENGEPTEEKVDAPEGSKFKISEDFTAPEGYEVKIDENTGEVTVTFPDESKLNKDTVEEFDVPVTVTYPDGSEDNAKAKFELDTDNDTVPDSKDNDDDNDGYTDEQEEEKGSNPKDKGSIPATPLQPGNPTDAATVEPGYEDGSGKPGEDVTVPAPEFKDKDGNPTTAPEGTTFGPGENAPEGVTVNEDGSVKVTIPEDANPGDKITVPVEVTYPDGSKDNVDVTVTVEEPDAPETPEEVDYRPSYGDPVVVPAGGSKTAEIAYPEDQTAPEGTKYVLDPSYTVPHGWKIEVDEATGQVTATVVEAGPDGARQEELVVPVLVKYPESANATGDDVANATFLLDTDKDGTPDTTDEDDDGDGVTDQEEKDNGSDPKDPNSKPEAPVNDFQPSYEEKTVPADQSVTSDVTFTGEPKPEGTEFSIAENFVAPHGWTFEVDPETGTVTATVVPAGPDGARQEQVIVPIVVTYPDGTATSDDTANAVFNLDTDADGKPDSTDDDDDGDGFTDEEEKEKGTDPKDPNDKPQPDAPAEDPKWEDTTTTPDKPVEIPNTGGDVPEGTTVDVTDGPGTAEIGEDGTITVTPNEGAKPGDKIVVEVKDPEGNVIDTVEVEIKDPNGGDDDSDKKPDWEDTSTTPDEPVEIPNTGGDVPEGTTVDVTDGPGTAEIGEDGTITVTPNEGAKPGDKIVVEVKDPEGNVIDTVEVEIKDPEDNEPGGPSGSLDDPNKIGAIIGGTIVGSGLIGALLGNHGDGAGSSAPGKPGEAKPGKPGAEKPGKGNAGDQGAGKGNAGNQSAGNGSTGATSQSTEAGSRGGSLAVTGVSGLAITLGASVIALALGGALMALRRRQS